jgi:Guanylate kinase
VQLLLSCVDVASTAVKPNLCGLLRDDGWHLWQAAHFWGEGSNLGETTPARQGRSSGALLTHMLVFTPRCRPKREGEVHGVDYFFVSKAQFEEWLAGGTLLEHAVVYGDYKGIPRQQVDPCLFCFMARSWPPSCSAVLSPLR